jgi:arsenite methyltransferase
MSAIRLLGLDNLADPSEQHHSAQQDQTKESFAYKWQRRDSYESGAMHRDLREWLFQRYCGTDPSVVDHWLEGGPKIILDAGCGAGVSALLLLGERLNHHHYLGVDISGAVDVAAQRFREQGIRGDFLRHDIAALPVPSGSLDIVFSEGVLHHTDNTGRTLSYLSEKLKRNGWFLFYVYAKKALIREYTDDCVRQAIASLSNAEAWEALKPLTKLGIALGRLEEDIEVPEDIPYLGIKKGKMPVQRFVYWNVLKAFYREEWSLEEMNHINFDWFRPLNCHRHTPDEIRGFCRDAGLAIVRMDVQDAGITVVARRL